MRFLFYSHDGLGLGHTRRNLALAAALTDAAPEASAIVVTGSSAAEDLGVPARVDIIRIPGLRKLGNGRYGARRLPLSGDDLCRVRAAALEAAVESFRPSVLVADKHPLGVRGELRPALEAIRRLGGQTVLGLRDILDEAGAAVREWAADDIPFQIERHYDRILVYGAERVLDFVGEYALSPALAERTRFCGYVVHPLVRTAVREAGPARSRRSRPLVLASAGAGEDGYEVLRTFMQAASGAPFDAAVVCGSNCPAPARASLERIARERGVQFRSFVPDLARRFADADALVCMGGYNTFAEALTAGTPVVCVPRSRPRREQLIRARAFARLGLARVIEPDQLEPVRLRSEVCAALAGPSRAVLAERAGSELDLDGAQTAADHLIELATRVPVAAVA
ncbi:MAG: glycosyltransferase family protein [Thermoleophilaceae bacterium]